MISTKIMVGLLVTYLIIVLFAISEKNFARALYFLGASLITVAVLQLK